MPQRVISRDFAKVLHCVFVVVIVVVVIVVVVSIVPLTTIAFSRT